jgi:hypothetical protein
MDSTNELVYQLLGCSLLQIDRSWWAVKLDNDEWLCEARIHTTPTGEIRHFDWTNDLVATGDIMRVKEVWLLCPANKRSPMGNTARMPIVEPGTAFQFKVGSADSDFVTTTKQMEGHIIGRVTNKETGACECFVWDARYRFMTRPWKTTVANMGTWRKNIPPRGPLELTQLGVKL